MSHDRLWLSHHLEDLTKFITMIEEGKGLKEIEKEIDKDKYRLLSILNEHCNVTEDEYNILRKRLILNDLTPYFVFPKEKDSIEIGEVSKDDSHEALLDGSAIFTTFNQLCKEIRTFTRIYVLESTIDYMFEHLRGSKRFSNVQSNAFHLLKSICEDSRYVIYPYNKFEKDGSDIIKHFSKFLDEHPDLTVVTTNIELSQYFLKNKSGKSLVLTRKETEMLSAFTEEGLEYVSEYPSDINEYWTSFGFILKDENDRLFLKNNAFVYIADESGILKAPDAEIEKGDFLIYGKPSTEIKCFRLGEKQFFKEIPDVEIKHLNSNMLALLEISYVY